MASLTTQDHDRSASDGAGGGACAPSGVPGLDDVLNGGFPRDRLSLIEGVLTLEQLAPAYGAERRRLRVVKLRGVRYRGGYHDFAIRTGGLEVFTRLVAADSREPFGPSPVSSGLGELDTLLGGGIERGTSMLSGMPRLTGSEPRPAEEHGR